MFHLHGRSVKKRVGVFGPEEVKVVETFIRNPDQQFTPCQYVGKASTVVLLVSMKMRIWLTMLTSSMPLGLAAGSQ